MNGPSGGDGNAEDNANGARFNHWRESFVEINTGLLRVPTADPTSFVTRERPIRIEFMTKNPFARDDVSTRRTRDERPGVV